jgi:hypothetical protein
MRERHGKDASYHPCVPPDAAPEAVEDEDQSHFRLERGEHLQLKRQPVEPAAESQHRPVAESGCWGATEQKTGLSAAKIKNLVRNTAYRIRATSTALVTLSRALERLHVGVLPTVVSLGAI